MRLERILGEQFCYLLGVKCDYAGLDMRAADIGIGLTKADLNALVINLQQAMREAEVPFSAENKLLTKLALMSRQIVDR